MFYRFSKIAFATRRHRQDSRLECGSISESTLMKCAIREYKDFRDAENIMPLATSDFRNPVCQEMRSLRFSIGSGGGGSIRSGGGGGGGSIRSGGGTESVGAEQLGSLLAEQKISPVQPSEMLSFARMYNEQGSYAKTYNEQGSVDSSDTYASCQTHPSHSQGDLTEEADSNLYVNPLEVTEKCRTGRVKKSISGEVGRNIITDASPSIESLKEIRFSNEASKVNLNDMIPKHRKIRIQQSIKSRAQFVSDQEGVVARGILKEDAATEDNNNHYGGLRGGKPSTFVPTNLASATRIINYHLFGSLGGSKHYTGASAESKLSLSADSIDSDGTPFMDRHRVSKSILKKSDSGNNYYSNTGDSDTEKLITDSVSTASMCDNETETCDSLANTRSSKKRPVSPLLSRQVLESIFRTNNNTEREYMSGEGEGKTVVARTPKILFGDVVKEEKHVRSEAVAEKQNKESDEQPRRVKTRVQEESKESPATTLKLRPHKTRKSTTTEEKRRANKSSGHGTYKSSDANCLPQEYRFS